MKFEIQKKLSGALGRAGKLKTPHGAIETPAFAAVGTKATVKALTPEQIKETGAQIVLGNTYHLYLEPGHETVQAAGGLGNFMGWNGPTMTDSGGFQVFSLGADFDKKAGKIKRGSDAAAARATVPQNSGIEAKREAEIKLPLADIDEEGVTFTSPRDGSKHHFTPERSIEIQHALGADIIFAFDECTSPDAPYAYQKEAMTRTHAWAARSLDAHRLPTIHCQLPTEKQMLFGIVQGGRHEELRKESARTIGTLDFDGFGIGGSFDKRDMGTAVRWVNEILPEEKPRHLLGIGDPTDMFGAIENGADLFDCVAPTRLARNGSLYTKAGRLNIRNAPFVSDFSPIEADCGCYTCQNFTRAYVAHLFRSGEILANTLASIHNLYFIIHLVEKARVAILNGDFFNLKKDFLAGYGG